MLNVLRESFKERPYLKWILLLVAASMTLYLGSYFGSGDEGSPNEWAAKVDGEAIPARQFLDTARDMDQYYSKLFGANYAQYKPSLQIPNQALQALIEQEIVRQDAREMGLAIGKHELAERIKSDSRLQENGQFVGLERYRQALARQPGGVAAFERELEDQMLLERWTDLVTQPVAVSDKELEEIFRKRTEKTAVSFVVVASANQKLDTSPAEDELRRWYDAEPERYRRGAGRRVRYAVVGREAQRSKVQLTEEEIRAAYEAQSTAFAHPEQRRARHILFRVEPTASEAERSQARSKAEQTLARIKQGEDFETLARSLSEDTATVTRGGDLGFFGRGQMVPAFEEAAFGTQVGQLAPIVEAPYGYHVVQVIAERPAGTRPLAEVEPQLRTQKEAERAQELAQAEAGRLRAEIESADTFSDVAGRASLQVEERTLFEGQPWTEMGVSPSDLEVLLRLEPGAVSDPIRVTTGYLLAAVDAAVPAAIAAFDDVRVQVQTDFLNQRARDTALSVARHALDGAGNVAGAARALHLELKDSGDIGPGEVLPGTGGTVPELQTRLHGSQAAVGDRGVIAVPAGALIYEIIRRDPFSPERFEQEKASLRAETLTERRTSYRQAILTKLRERHEIEFNYELLQRYSS